MNKLNRNNRIAVNTGVLYLRVILSLFLTLYSTRFVLKGLGEENFGIYNLIAGVAALFSFISGTMAATTQRFISYELGASNNVKQLSNIFATSFKLHFVIAIIVTSIVITSGILLIEDVLSIPEQNIQLAKGVLICVGVGLIGTIVSVPFEAILMAHENIVFFALIQFFGTIVKFGIALLLLVLSSNKLIIYSLLMAIVPFLLLIFQADYCRKNYPETCIKNIKFRGNPYIKQMTAFASYALFGNIGWTIRTQGFSMVLNIFWGVLINAANGIANQVSAALLTFSSSLTTSIRPQLIQAAGEGNRDRLIKLTLAACKYPMIILSILGIPLFISMPYILELWLKNVPEYSVIFCRILILDVLLNQSTLGLALIMDAKGEIKVLHKLVGLSLILTTVCAFFAAKYSDSIPFVYSLIIINDMIIIIIRILIVRYYLNKWHFEIDFNRTFLTNLLKPFAITIPILFLCTFFCQYYTSSLSITFFVAALGLCSYLLTGWFLLLNKNEHKKILELKNIIVKLGKK